MNVQQLVSSVVAYAGRQHEDSAWAIVAEGMRRDDIAVVIQGCRTVNQARRAMRAELVALTSA
jgi:hypothetical protein